MLITADARSLGGTGDTVPTLIIRGWQEIIPFAKDSSRTAPGRLVRTLEHGWCQHMIATDDERHRLLIPRPLGYQDLFDRGDHTGRDGRHAGTTSCKSALGTFEDSLC